MVDDKSESGKLEDTGRGAEAPSAPEMKPVAPPVPPPLTHEFHEHDGRRWPTIVVYLIIALIVATLIVLLARAIYHSTQNNHPAPNSTNNTPKPPSGNETNKTGNHKTSGSGNSISSTGVVPNTGPGDAIAIFTVVSLAAAGLHYIVSLRRAR